MRSYPEYKGVVTDDDGDTIETKADGGLIRICTGGTWGRPVWLTPAQLAEHIERCQEALFITHELYPDDDKGQLSAILAAERSE